MKKLILIPVVFAMFIALAATAHGASPGYYDELVVSNTVEVGRYSYDGRMFRVDSAFCSGIRRFGVRDGGYGLDKYRVFKCMVSGADDHMYTIMVRTHPKMKILSVKRDF